jgi:exosortase A
MFLKSPAGAVAPSSPMPAAPLSRTSVVLIALALLAPFLLYLGTVRSIVSIWNSSETFAHGYVILPISLWLIWRRRENFSLYPPRPYAPALVLLALLGIGWLAAQLGEVQVVSQYMFVAMFPVAALALLGPRLAGSLAFPLLFLLFAVPFGEIFVAPLIQFTADFTVWAVRATGIPVLRNGTRFELPTGSWSVVEACSGVRYLISSITLGCLYAYLTYRSTRRRVMFIALAMVVPVIANGLRAYMIVMIGHLSGMALATGVDHLIYGWLFFGLVMFIMFWIGGFWREDNVDLQTATPAIAAAAADADPVPTGARAAARNVAAIALATVVLCALWPAAAFVSERVNHNPAPVRLPAVAVTWPQTGAVADWQPFYMKPDASFHEAYRNPAAGATLPVGLTLLYYRNQDGTKTLISSLNRLAGYEDAWHEVESAGRTEAMLGQPLGLHEGILHASQGNIMVWSFKWIGGRYTSSDYLGKLYQAGAKALLRGDDGAAIMLAVPYDNDKDAARAALRRFLSEQGPAIDQALNTARAQ